MAKIKTRRAGQSVIPTGAGAIPISTPDILVDACIKSEDLKVYEDMYVNALTHELGARITQRICLARMHELYAQSNCISFEQYIASRDFLSEIGKTSLYLYVREGKAYLEYLPKLRAIGYNTDYHGTQKLRHLPKALENAEGEEGKTKVWQALLKNSLVEFKELAESTHPESPSSRAQTEPEQRKTENNTIERDDDGGDIIETQDYTWGTIDDSMVVVRCNSCGQHSTWPKYIVVEKCPHCEW